MTSRRPSPKPSTALAAAALTCVYMGACTQATSPSPTLTVKGTVVDTTSGTPVSGATVYAFGARGVAPVKTDDGGAYAISGIAPGTLVSLWSQASDHVQPCFVSVLVNQDTTATLASISVGAIAVFNASAAGQIPGTRTVTGQVFESTSAGRSPVPGVAIQATATLATGANTVSDGAGRYLLCGLPEAQTLRLFAELLDKSGGITITAGTGDATADIEISRF